MKKITSFIIMFLIMLLIPVFACADDLEEMQNKENVLNTEINSLSQKREALANEITSIDQDLRELQNSVLDLNKKVEELSVSLESQIEDEKRYKEQFFKRLSKMYEQGAGIYADVVLNTDSISDMTDRVEIMKQIAEYDEKTYMKFVEARQETEKRKQELEEQIKEYDTKKLDLDGKLAEKNKEISELDEKLKNQKSELSSVQEQIHKTSTSVEYADQIFEEGEKYLGYPYVFGGSSPETSFDCSGFVCWVLNHSGVMSIGRTTAQGVYDQIQHISESEAKRGDIIFFQGTYNAGETITHIGFYAGDGQMLHCGNPIQYTSTNSDYWKSHFYGYGRIK